MPLLTTQDSVNSLMKTRMICSVMAVGTLFAGSAVAHKNKPHPAPRIPTDSAPSRVETADSAIFRRINESFTANVKPIFRKKCMDCHGGQTVYPSYYRIPGIRQLIDHDIEEAREHLDFSGGFPFKSHARPKEDLDAIEKTTREGSMPLLRYRLMHPGTKLSEEEKKTILEWAASSKKLLR